MRAENADRACGDIIPPPSRSSFYIVRSRSPLTVNNRRFRAVTSGTRDSRSIPRAYVRDGMQASVMDPEREPGATLIDVAEEPRDRGKLSKDNARGEREKSDVGAAGISGFERDVRILRGSIYSRACLCVRVAATRWMNREEASRTVEEFLDTISGFVHRTRA